jgi:hypothetical protein
MLCLIPDYVMLGQVLSVYARLGKYRPGYARLVRVIPSVNILGPGSSMLVHISLLYFRLGMLGHVRTGYGK